MAEQLLAFAKGWEGLGFAGLCLLALVFLAGALSYIPRFTFYSIGGAVFGLAAIPAAILGSVVGATIAFLLARYALRDAFERQVEKRPRWRKILSAVNTEGWRLVVLTRFTSPLPGGAINYVFGLTAVGLVPYVVATALGLLPPVAAFTGFGMLGRVALSGAEPSSAERAISAASLIVIAITVMLIVRRMRAAPR